MNTISWLKSHAGYYDRIDSDTFEYPVLIPKLLEYGDYGGSHVEKSNHEVFLAEFGDNKWVDIIIDYYGYHAVALHPNALKNTDIVETLAALEQYPLIDDEHYSRITWEAYQEAFSDYGVRDLSRELYRRLERENYPRCGEFLFDHDDDDFIAIWQAWYESMIPSGEYYFDENGGLGSGLYLPTDDVVKHTTKSDIVKLIKEIKNIK